MKKNPLNKTQNQKLKELAQKYNLKLLVLFGSYAKGTQKNTSDYDFAFQSNKPISAKQYLKLNEEITTLLNNKIDLINLEENTNVTLHLEIFQKGICIYESHKHIFENKKERSFFNYIDFKTLYGHLENKFLNTPTN